MNFDYTDKVKDMQARLLAFMDAHIYPNEKRFFAEIAENRAKGNAWIPTKIVEELKPKALGLSSSTIFVGIHALPLARFSAISAKNLFSLG